MAGHTWTDRSGAGTRYWASIVSSQTGATWPPWYLAEISGPPVMAGATWTDRSSAGAATGFPSRPLQTGATWPP